MKSLPLFAALAFALCPVANAVAGQCETNFTTEGDPRNGAEYATSVTMANVGVGSALAQMRVITMANKFKFLNETGDERSGSIVVEQPRTYRYAAFPVTVTAKAQGGATQVGMQFRASRGTDLKEGETRSYMCGMLAQIKAGKEGDKLAGDVRKTAGAGTSPTVSTTPIKLSVEISKQVQNGFKAGASDQVITERYTGRSYRIDGQLFTKEVETYGARPGSHGIELTFDVRKPGDAPGSNVTRTSIVCEMAPGQERFINNLREHDYLTLTGTFRVFEGGRFILTGCRPAK
jgi:hypothetical protein